jgi:hypothetical protein
MNTLTLILILIIAPSPISPSIVDISVDHCKNVTPERVIEAKLIARKLYEIEKSFKVPKKLEGMLLAAACAESGFNPNATGDRKFSKNKRTPKAIGILQLWPWWESGRWGYKVNRKDPEASAKAWMKHIVKQIPSVRKKCKPKSKSLLWIQAWVQAIRSPKPSGRCREKPKHLRFLRKFQKIQKRGKPKS